MRRESVSSRIKYRILYSISLAVILFSGCQGKAPEKNSNLISELGRYSGYSKPVYSEWVRTSQYIEVRDGTKLAFDIIRPAEI